MKILTKRNFFKMYLPVVGKQPSSLKGFTLVELLLAMAITSILVLGMNAIFRQVKLIYSKTESKRHIYQQARFLSELLRNDLSSLYFFPEAEAGPSSNLSLTSKAHNEVELAFFTLNPSFQTNPLSCRIAKVSYEFGINENTGKTVLQRYEQPYAIEKELGPAHSDIIASKLTKFQILALNRGVNTRLNEWKSSYTSKEIPPKALKISFAWQLEIDSPVVEFHTVLSIPCQEPLTFPE